VPLLQRRRRNCGEAGVTVVVDAVSARVGGGLTYLTSQLPALERARPDAHLIVYAQPAAATILRGLLRGPVREVRWPTPLGRFLYSQIMIPISAPRLAQLYCPGNFASLLTRRRAIVLALQNPNYFGQGRLQKHNASPIRRARAGLSRFSASRARTVIAISKSLAEQVEIDLPGLSDLRVIYSGAPAWVEERLETRLKPPPYKYLLSVANDYPHKRLEDIVTAWVLAAADAAVSDIHLILVGSISARRVTELKGFVRPELQPHLHFMGTMNQPDVRAMYEAAIAAISAAELEAFPLTPGEAASVGCPLVISDIAPHREVTLGRATFFPVRDTAALAQELVTIAAQPPWREPWSWPHSWDDNACQLWEALLPTAVVE